MSAQPSGSQPQEITQLFVNFGIPVCNNPNCLFDPNTPLCESTILDLPPQLVTVEVVTPMILKESSDMFAFDGVLSLTFVSNSSCRQ